MKNLVLASAALMALSFGGNAVLAADMPVKAPPVAVYSWSGCYVGVQAGYKWGRSRQEYGGLAGGVPNAFVPTGTDLSGLYNVNGAVGGGEAGCNYQVGNWVFGVEVDGSWSAASGQSGPTPVALAAGLTSRFRFVTDERWLATARGRIGYAWDKWLWYVTGGGAWSGFDVNNFDSGTVAGGAGRVPTRVSRSGWVVGYGTEYHVSHGWSVKAESLYIDYGKFHYGDEPASVNNCQFGCLNADVRMYEWIWRVGMNYKFDWYTPVVAKY
jgi:outer membrane immunogenic protein